MYRVIKKAPHISRQRLRKFPALKQSHKDARIAFAINHITWTSEWNMVILGVDNCLNFGFRSFFLMKKSGIVMVLMDGIRIGEISAKNQEFLVRGFGGGSVMTWAAISSFGRLSCVC